MSDRWSITTGDCVPYLASMDAASVDHVITDPPYNAKTHKPGAIKTNKFTTPDCAEKIINLGFEQITPKDIAPLMLRVSRRWIVAFCATEMLGAYEEAVGPKQWIRSGAWDRPDGMPQISGDRPAQGFEGIAVMHRPGKKRWNGGGKRGVWRCNIVKRDRTGHPTQKPLSLMLQLVEDFTDLGDTILDPFCGSGTTGVACLQLGRQFIGIEKDSKYAKIARARLRAEDKGLTYQQAKAGQRGIFG